MLAPNGVEEERGPGYVEYAIYGGEGELPELGELDAAVGGGRVEVSATEIPDDWADRWRDFHKPLLVGGRLWLRPSWEPPREGAIDVVVDPGQAFGTGAHPTTRLCLELLLELEAAGRRRTAGRPRHRLRRARDRRREARLGPGRAATTTSRPRSRRRPPTPRPTASSSIWSARTCASACPSSPRTVVANMTARSCAAVAAQLDPERGAAIAGPARACCRTSWTRSAAAFAPAGLAEARPPPSTATGPRSPARGIRPP